MRSAETAVRKSLRVEAEDLTCSVLGDRCSWPNKSLRNRNKSRELAPEQDRSLPVRASQDIGEACSFLALNFMVIS